jgi:enoyl-CoA hydratase/carnithine racemase
MKIVSFNINGVRARPHQLSHLVDHLQPDIVGLQETKVRDEDFPVNIFDDLDDEVLAIAGRIAKIPQDLLALNKRAAHRAMEAMGIRTGIRATAEIQAMGFHQPSSKEYMGSFRTKGVKEALSDRDKAFGDYRERSDD